MKITENYFENDRYNLTLDLSSDEFENLFVRCHDCGNIMLRDDEDILTYDGNYYCPNCTFECYGCGKILPLSHSYPVEDSSSLYCESCYDNETYHCASCGNHYRYEDSLHYSEHDDADYCSNCYDERGSILGDYHDFKEYGSIRFLGEEARNDSPYIGFELEVDSHDYVDVNDAVNDVRSLLPCDDFFHFEHDGSLSDNGFEQISQPCSLAYHLSLTSTYRQVFKTLISHGERSHDISSCGFHCHIDRTFFNGKQDSSIAKLLYIFEKFKDELLLFSRRTSYQVSDWCSFRKTENTSANWIKNTVKDSKGYLPHDERYHAINLTNSETIEIRLWRGTLNISTFIATLKFTDRLARLAKGTRAVDLARMSFLDLLGDDEDIKTYWSRVKNRNSETQEDF